MTDDLAVWAELEVEQGEEGLMVNKAGYSGKALATDYRVPGRVRGKDQEYVELGADKYIVDMVRDGYKLLFEVMPPPPSFTVNKRSALEDPAFVRA